MRILMINSLYPPIRFGGAERSVALLAEVVAAAGEDVHVATLHQRADETHAVERGVTVHRLPLDNDFWAWPVGRQAAWRRFRWHWRDRWNRRAAKRVEHLIAEIRPEVVHAHVLTGFGPAIWPMVKARGLPLVQTIRDYSLICSRAALFRHGRPCAGRCGSCRWLTAPSASASRHVDALIGNSDFMIKAFRRAGRFSGVEAQRLFNVVPPVRVEAAPAHIGPLRFGFLGRIEQEKGIEILLAAIRSIGRKSWHLAIGGVGNGNYVRALKAGTPDRRIAWLGDVEADRFHRSIDVLIVPSIWPEPMPRTMIEAIAHGRAVIAARSGGIPEAAEFARRIALYRADDPAALAAAMRTAIDDAEAWRPDGSTSSALPDAFSAAAAVAAHRQIYARVLAGR